MTYGQSSGYGTLRGALWYYVTVHDVVQHVLCRVESFKISACHSIKPAMPSSYKAEPASQRAPALAAAAPAPDNTLKPGNEGWIADTAGALYYSRRQLL